LYITLLLMSIFAYPKMRHITLLPGRAAA